MITKKRFYVFSWTPYSKSAKELAKALGGKRIKHDNSKFKGTLKKVVVNWGASALPVQLFQAGALLNNPNNVIVAKNKLALFQKFTEAANVGEAPRVPDWTNYREVAETWLSQGHTVVARTILNGHSGKGIKILEKPLDICNAPLYTIYKKKYHEYRVHLAYPDTVFFVQRKAVRNDYEGEPNYKVRSHDNGFVYIHKEVHPHPDVIEQAVRAFKVSGLDFGAVDVIWNKKEQQAYVLEINTAPGLEGTTVEKYANAIKELVV